MFHNVATSNIKSRQELWGRSERRAIPVTRATLNTRTQLLFQIYLPAASCSSSSHTYPIYAAKKRFLRFDCGTHDFGKTAAAEAAKLRELNGRLKLILGPISILPLLTVTSLVNISSAHKNIR